MCLPLPGPAGKGAPAAKAKGEGKKVGSPGCAESLVNWPLNRGKKKLGLSNSSGGESHDIT